MQRRDALRALSLAALPGLLSACGGGSDAAVPIANLMSIESFKSERSHYYVGETAMVTAVFKGGSGRIEPGDIVAASGIPMEIAVLAASASLRLVVSAGGKSIERELHLTVVYRSTFQALSMGFSRTQHVTAQDSRGHLLVIGGEDNMPSMPSQVFAFDPFTERFSAAGALLTGRRRHTATALADGTVLVFGGIRDTASAPFAERFDSRSGSSRATGSQPLWNRMDHSATLLADGRVFLAGGNVFGESRSSNIIDIYDPAADAFSRLTSALLVGRRGHSATRVNDDTILIHGGTTADGAMAPPELFSLKTQTSSLVLPPLEARARVEHAAVRLNNGDVVVLGGEDYTMGDAIDTVLRFSTPAKAYTSTTQLQLGRARMAAVALTDGRVLVSGGSSRFFSVGVASTELYLPASNSTASGPSMAEARMLHTSDLLVTGKVLIVGGTRENQELAATAELFR